jgi:hypothetical protein
MAKNVVYVDLYEILPTVEIDYSHWRKSERDDVNPALRELGYNFRDDGWWSSDSDSFGPLVRALAATDQNGKKVVISYG